MAYKADTYTPGRMDAEIIIKSKAATQNEYGEEVVTYPTTIASVWADRDYQSGKEFWAGSAGTEASKAVQKVNKYTFRYVDGLTEGMVIFDGAEMYDITKIAELNRRQYHQVIAQLNLA